MATLWARRCKAAIFIAICPVLLVGACRHGILKSTPSADSATLWLKSTLGAPFRSVDHQQFTNAYSAATLANYRVKPASAALGKKELTLEDCRKFALANNLDIQVARLDEFTKNAVEYSNRTKLLPHFLFTGDLSERDNPLYSYSDVLGQEGRAPNPGQSGPNATGVTNFSTSHERSTWHYALETRWSPTDAALAYYLTRSGRNDRLKAHYQRIKVAQKMVALVDASFLRLLGFQEALPLAEREVVIRSRVAEKMKKLYIKKITGIEEYNRAVQQDTRARRVLARVRNQIEKQRNILASAMGLSPDYCVDGGFRVVGMLSEPHLDMELCDMELKAVRSRPEAFEAGLNHLNSTNDLKRTIVKFFPKVSGFWRYSRDKDKYLYNKDWKEVGMAVYFDLVDWLSNLDESRAASFNASKTQQEMGTVALGITSQVRIAALQFYDALDELRSSQTAVKATSEVVRVARQRASKEDLDRIAMEEAEANMLRDTLEQTRALGEANANLAELQGAMGANYGEPVPHN